MSASIIRFRARRSVTRNCLGCGSHFSPSVPHHSLCRRCFHWGRAGWFLAQAAQALQEGA